jgi:biotin transporter BioY
MIVAMLAGNAAIYALGLPWLAAYVGQRAVALGLLPYLAGDVVKLAVATALLPMGWKIVRNRGG